MVGAYDQNLYVVPQFQRVIPEECERRTEHLLVIIQAPGLRDVEEDLCMYNQRQTEGPRGCQEQTHLCMLHDKKLTSWSQIHLSTGSG